MGTACCNGMPQHELATEASPTKKCQAKPKNNSIQKIRKELEAKKKELSELEK